MSRILQFQYHAGSLTNGTGGALLSNPWGIYVSGHYAYIASLYSDALEIVDLLPVPIVTAITPNTSFNSTTVSITNLEGDNFFNGATVYLNRTGISNPVHTGSIVNGTGGALLDGPTKVDSLRQLCLCGKLSE